MEWTKVQVSTTAVGAEIVTGLLLAEGISGTEILSAKERVRHLTETAAHWDYAEADLLDATVEVVRVVFYVAKDEPHVLENVRRAVAALNVPGIDLGSLEISTRAANDEAWLNVWRAHFKPLKIGRVVIVPDWEEYTPAPGEICFRIDPGSAFGTGQHETTRLCITALQEYICGGETVLDIGCGSGILSIISLLLGAHKVLACDIDPAGAIAATKYNAALNGFAVATDDVPPPRPDAMAVPPIPDAEQRDSAAAGEKGEHPPASPLRGEAATPLSPAEGRLTLRAGDVLSDENLRAEISRDKYDIIVANIVADVVAELAPFARGSMRDGGVFIASGIISERAGDVLRSFRDCGMTAEKFELHNWVLFVGRAEA